jgi:hypothetical protein
MNDLSADMRRALKLAVWPPLCRDGFGDFDRSRETLIQFNSRRRQEQERMFEPETLSEFEATRDWLRQFPKLKAINRSRLSRDLKLVVEGALGRPIAHGVLLAAALAEGFEVKHNLSNPDPASCTPDVYLNISNKAWNVTKRKDPRQMNLFAASPEQRSR